MRQSLYLKFFQQCLYHRKFWENASSKIWRYILQQLFEMLSVSLDTGLESFSSLLNGPVNVSCRQSRQWLLRFSHPRRVLASGLRASVWCCCCHGNCAGGTQPIWNFSNAVNPQLHTDAFYEKSFIRGVFSWSYANLLKASGFLKHSVFLISNFCSPEFMAWLRSREWNRSTPM